jgi:hypothetical protein
MMKNKGTFLNLKGVKKNGLQFSSAGSELKTVNPSTEHILYEYEIITKEQLNNSK